MSIEATSAARLPVGLRLAAGVVAGSCLLLLVGRLLFDVAGPIGSDDLWWHLSLGNAYLEQGPWIDADPLLYTASAPPHPNSWLFDVLVSAIATNGGLNALRAFHVSAVLGVLALLGWLLRRELSPRSLGFFAASVLIVLMADRLGRLRPELFSMAAVLLLYGLLFASERAPSWRRVGAATLLVGIWANFHAAFAVGPLLLCAAWVGFALRLVLEKSAGRHDEHTRTWLLRLGSAIVLGLLAALLNPRGIEQHLSYLAASAGPALAAIGDDWVRFDPQSGGRTQAKLGVVVWAVADALLLASVLCSGICALRLWKRRDAETLRAADPVLFGLAVASWIAIFVSQRFLWLSIFPLLFVLRSLLAFRAGRFAAPLFAALAIWLVLSHGRALKIPSPDELRAHLERPIARRYPVDTVRFLVDTGVRGHLFGRYSTGAFLGYWLAPELRTSVNGTLNFPAEVFSDYFAIVNGSGSSPQQSFVETLERHDVDLFLGEGMPQELLGSKYFYTTILLESDPDWLLVQRRPNAAIYLRRSERNRENLQRIEAYYSLQQIPFDRDRGLDVAAILWGRSDWAIGERMLPANYPELLETSRGRAPMKAYEALAQLASLHLLLGDYAAQVEFDRRAVAIAPRLQAPKRRLVFGLLRLGRKQEAAASARTMNLLAPGDPVAALFQRAVELDSELGSVGVPSERIEAAQRFQRRLPVVQRGRYAADVAPLLLPAPAVDSLRPGR